MPKTKKIKVLDLFAGAGGFSEGFVNAGCNMVAHIEMNKDACETIRTRTIYHSLKKIGRLSEYKKYMLGEIDRDEIVEKYNLQNEIDSVINAEIKKDNYKELINQVRKKIGKEKMDIIIGGPPCQAFSIIGRSRDKNNMRWDKRNTLYKYYIEFLKEFKPKIFVFENVPGLLSAAKSRHFNTMKRMMRKEGYEIGYKIINAAEYGVPQRRRRVILIGWNEYSKLIKYPEFKKVERKYNVGDFLINLPELKAGQKVDAVEYNEESDVVKSLKICNPEVNVLESHIARPNTDQDLNIYKKAVLIKKRGINLNYNDLPEKLKTHKNRKGFLDRFKVVDFESSACQTVVAHISKDGHYYIHPDIKQNRSLSVREAARLQTFSDDYKFEGSRTAQFKQIGNAVPLMLSNLIAPKLIKYV
ncbi:MAG: DNA cytosine methyltransferase [Candidatus Pacebacteria bacterium]|nr:DNA cytosine methyltransferase [Candidatus Paceibacterota bacterium]